MVYAQVVHNEEDLLMRVRNQSSHKADQFLLVHGVLVYHVTQATILADRSNHIDPFALSLHRQNRRLPFGREPTLHDLPVVNTSLVGPEYLSIFKGCQPFDLRKLLRFPPLDTLRILLPGAFHRTLAGEPPASHIVGCATVRNVFSVPFLHQCAHLFQCPKVARYAMLLRSGFYDYLPYLRLLFRR